MDGLVNFILVEFGLDEADGLVKFNLFEFSLVEANVTNRKKKKKKIHDDMLRCCATKNYAVGLISISE